ncbi:2OG-Fe dioxygenase family protein [Arenibaculum sp.]|uniref:2OG-Fe dioxygenase family protein n=1 Tax=Arenibaculum sp. TaxID=2865862 RepID=UPI002E160A24|nr:2OG-Fe dioxygenase family protein [Arenibaculum sp.]
MRSIEEIVRDDDVNDLTNLGPRRYRVADFEITSRRTIEAFDNLVLDPYCGQGRGALSGGRHRYRRYDDFRMTFRDGRWHCELQPHRPFIQSPRFNRAVGGLPRHLEPLEIDPSPEMDRLFKAFGFDTSREFHAKIHQIRVITSSDIHGVAVVEGPHRDGQEWQIVAVFQRHDIVGGESQFLPNGGGKPFFAQVLQPGQAVCNEDAAMWHNATDIAPAEPGGTGYRDIWIIATNRWEHRRYGDEFEAASLGEGKADWTASRPEESPQVTPLR